MQNFRGQTRCIMGDVQMVNVPRVPIFRSLKGSCIHSFVIYHLSGGEKMPRKRSLYFAGYVPQASQSPYPTIVYSVAMDPILVIFNLGRYVIFAIPTKSLSIFMN